MKFHNCELCGHDEELLGVFDTLSQARQAAQDEESQPIDWEDDETGCGDSIYRYYVYSTNKRS